MRIATGEIEDDAPADDGKNQAAVELGKKGGAARAAKLTAEERAEIARKAAAKRWSKQAIIGRHAKYACLSFTEHEEGSHPSKHGASDLDEDDA